MNNKRAINAYLSKLIIKKQDKQAKQKQNHRYREHLMVA